MTQPHTFRRTLVEALWRPLYVILAAASTVAGLVGPLVLPSWPAVVWPSLTAIVVISIVLHGAHNFIGSREREVDERARRLELDPDVRIWRGMQAVRKTWEEASMTAADLFIECAGEMSTGFTIYKIIEHISARRRWLANSTNAIVWQLLPELEAAGVILIRRPTEPRDLARATITEMGSRVLGVGRSELLAQQQRNETA